MSGKYELSRTLRAFVAAGLIVAIVCLVRLGPDSGYAQVRGVDPQSSTSAAKDRATQIDEEALGADISQRSSVPIASDEIPARAREIQVVDQDEVAVEGAQLFDQGSWQADGSGPYGTLLATTDGAGLATVDGSMLYPNVWLIAPGHRVEYLEVPTQELRWIIHLARANRIEVVLLGEADVSGFHVEIQLPASFHQQTFYQEQYVQTPGRVVDGTLGHWRPEGDGSRWSLAFTPERRAVVDQIFENGNIKLSLWRFGIEIEQRVVELLADGRSVRVEFTPSRVPPSLQGLVVDATAKPINAASLCLAPAGGTLSIGEHNAFPVWAPRTMSAYDGTFCLPRPDDPAERCVIRSAGFAARVMTIAEIEAARGQIRLEPARVVLLDVLDRDGERMEVGGANWSECVEPSVLVGHDVWGMGDGNVGPADGGQLAGPGCFRFDQLPSGVVQFRFSHHDPELILEHDTRDRIVHWVSPRSVDELQLGK